MSALAFAPALAPAPRVDAARRDLLVLFDVQGEILWCNAAACDWFGPAGSVVEVLRSGRRLPPLTSLPLGPWRLWLSAGSASRLHETLRRLNRLLWESYRRRGLRNLDLSRAEGRFDLHQKRAAREEYLRRAAAEALQAVEEERGRIARELHDNTGQSLAGILLNLELVERHLGSSNTEVLARLTRSRELAGTTLDQVRRIAHELHAPEWGDQNFAEAVDWLLDRMALRSRLDVDAGDIDLPRDLSPALLTVLYRTLQEGLTNVLRHADARRVRIEASTSPRGVTLILQDDGRGFDPNAPRSASAGIGLANLRRRLQSLGGRLEIRSAPGEGARLAVFVPPAAGPLHRG